MYCPNVDLDFPLTYPVYLCSLSKTSTHLSLGSSATHPHISIWVLQQHIHTLTMISGEAVDDVHVIPQGLLVFSSHQ